MLQPTVGEAVHIVAPSNAIQRVGFQHGIEGNSAQLNAIISQNTAIELQILANLQQAVIFQQGFE